MSSGNQLDRDRGIAYAILRFTTGINFLVHGLVRLPKLMAFSSAVAAGFSDTILPEALVKPYAVAIPFVEGLVGILLVLGFKTRFALAVGGLLMSTLVFGTALKEDWPTLGSQMLYALILWTLAHNSHRNAFCLDGRVRDVGDASNNRTSA